MCVYIYDVYPVSSRPESSLRNRDCAKSPGETTAMLLQFSAPVCAMIDVTKERESYIPRLGAGKGSKVQLCLSLCARDRLSCAQAVLFLPWTFVFGFAAGCGW